jgi:structure-specific recognition protein 1
VVKVVIFVFTFQEKERLAKFFSHYYDMDMLDRELSVKGWNWGTASFNGAVMNFQVCDYLTIPEA